MRQGPHFRMLLGGGGLAAKPNGPLAVEFCKRTIISGATLLANDFIPNGATIISVQAPVGGVVALTGGFPDIQWDDDGAGGLTPASFTYTIQDNVTAETSTATVSLQPFFPATVCVDDGPGGLFVATEFHPLILPKFGGGSITANDTFGGATSPSPNVANPVTVTVLTQEPEVYVTLFDSSTPNIYTLIIPPGINQIEIECWGAQGGRGGNLIPNPVGGGPGLPAGFGAHRLVTNLSVVPGQVLSIAVGGVGTQGDDTLASPASGGNIGSGGPAGLGFADNKTSGTFIQLDSFGFPDGVAASPSGGSGVCTGCDGAGGGGGQDAPVNHSLGAGGGGGAGSAVTVGDATTSSGVPFNRLGPVLNTAGGGGGGSGALTFATNRDAGQDGGPPSVNRDPASTFFGSRGDTGGFGSATGGGTGGGGGGYRGGDSFPTTDVLSGRRRGFGGESNDERYKIAGERTVGNRTPSIQFGAQEVWPAFSGSTTTEFASLNVGNGRVRIRGRAIVDQLGGTQFPIHCQVVDLGATIQVTPDIPWNAAGSATNECSFFYFLTDTKTGQTSSVCQVRMDIIANSVIAVNDGPFGVTESVNSNIAIATLESNDTVPGTPIFALVPGSDVNLNSFAIVGSNVRVNSVDRAVSTTASFQYSITDPLMPSGFELLPGRKTDIATVNLNINLPTPIANDNPGPAVTEELGQGAASVLVAKAFLLVNDNCGSQPCTFSTSGLVAVNNCIIVNTAGANVEVKAAGPVGDGDCIWQYRVQNAQGVFSGFATVTHTVDPVVFGNVFDTGFHGGDFNLTRGFEIVPVGVTLMKSEVWGASGGDGNDGLGGIGGAGAVRTCISVVTPGQSIEYACGQMGLDGGLANSFIAIGGGPRGQIQISGVDIFPNGKSMHGVHHGNVCPLDSDGGTPFIGEFPSGGIGGTGDDSPLIGGGGGGGAGSAVWFGEFATFNIINIGAGGGGGGSLGAGANGTAVQFAAGCSGLGRSINVPDPIPNPRGKGAGGGGIRGGDTTQDFGAQIGGPGGGSGGNPGRFIAGSDSLAVGPLNQPGRVRLSYA